ncbi:MAG: helix-turn-helix transcriptional regulator [Chloroflexi bacterium]|nr:helix-turn-helix transcriptional regulator [Chloroflexota bacterium]
MTSDFATWIRDEINRRGWSEATLAERAGLSRSSISKMLTSDQRSPGMRFFAGSAAAFEMPLADVILIEKRSRQRENQDTEILGRRLE